MLQKTISAYLYIRFRLRAITSTPAWILSVTVYDKNNEKSNEKKS